MTAKVGLDGARPRGRRETGAGCLGLAAWGWLPGDGWGLINNIPPRVAIGFLGRGRGWERCVCRNSRKFEPLIQKSKKFEPLSQKSYL